MALTLEEQETVVNLNRADGDMFIYTSDPAMMEKLSKMPGYTLTRERKDRQGNTASLEFTASKRLLTLRAKKEYTPEERAIMAARLKQAKEARLQK